MPRRPIDDGADLWLADSEGSGGIEIIDPGTLADPDPGSDDVVESSPGRSPLGVIAAVALGVLVAVGVVRTGNTPAPEPPAPSVTTQPEPPSAAELERQAEIAELEAAYGVEIGDGPDLTWQQVVWNIDTTFFYWLDDGFVGSDGITEWTIRRSEVGPTVAQRESLQQQYPGYLLRYIDGARLLVPEEADDHLLVITGNPDPGQERPIEIELPPLAVEPTTDLISNDRIWVSGVALDDSVILLSYNAVSVDADALATRLGLDATSAEWIEIWDDSIHIYSNSARPTIVPFDETDLTDVETADLRLSRRVGSEAIALRLDLDERRTEPLPFGITNFGDGPVRTDTGIGLAFMGDAGSSYATSADGSEWTTISATTGNGWIAASGSRLYRFPWNGNEIQRSPDAGATWVSTRLPLRNTSMPPVVVDDVLFVTNEVFLDVPPSTDGVEFEVDGGYRVRLRSQFEPVLVEATTGNVVEARLEYLSTGLVFEDPDTGEELVRVPSGAVSNALAIAQDAPPPTLAVARWNPVVPDPEWHIEPIDEVFPNAVRVSFVPGGGHVLAVVSTPQGTDLYIASTRP